MADMKLLINRVLTALYAREPHVKVVMAATGGGTSVSELLFRAGSSSTMLQYSVPYARASLERFVSHGDHLSAPLPKFCSSEMADRMALSAWHQAQQILLDQADEGGEDPLSRFHAAIGVGCTAALATNYDRRGVNQAFISICRVDTAAAVEQTRCESFHLHLDKTLQRSRLEEDHLVSQHIVYLLAKTAGVDPEGCEALLQALKATLTGPQDRFQLLPPATNMLPNSTIHDALSALNTKTLASLAFLPSSGNVSTVARYFPFKGLVLSGSFNPVHRGHLDLALAAQRLVKHKLTKDLPIAFEIAVANADKGSIATDTVMKRVQQFSGEAEADGGTNNSTLGKWPVLVTNATLFSQKAVLLKDCVFIIGADTAVRLVDKKYYGMDDHQMVLVLHEIASKGCSFVVAGRFDEKDAKRFISAEEVLEQHIPPVLKHLFMALREEDFRSDLSSTQLRNARKAGD